MRIPPTLLLFTLLPLILLTAPARAADTTVRIAFGESLEPYINHDGQSGLEVDIIRAALSERGLFLKPLTVSQPRLGKALLQTDVDGVATVLPESYPKAAFSDVYIHYEDVAIVLADSHIRLDSIADLARYRVLAFPMARQYLGPEFAAMANANPRYAEAANQIDQNRLLYRGAIDVVVADRNIFAGMDQKLRQTYLESPALVKEYHLFVRIPYRIAFKNERLRNEFNQGLQAIQRNGVYQKLTRRFRLQSESSSPMETQAPPR